MASVTVRLPGVLDGISGGRRTVSVQGETPAAALQDLCAQVPALRPRLFDDAGRWRRHILCVLASEPIDPHDEAIVLADGDELTVMPAVSGG